MSGVIRFIGGMAIMFVGVFTGNLALAKAGYYLAMSGLIEEASKLFLPKPPPTRMRQDVEYFGTVEPRRIIYGEGRVGGMNTIRPIVTGDGKLLWSVLTVAGHRIEAMSSVYFNQDEITNAQISAVSGTTNDGKVSAGTYQGYAWIRRYLGTSTQTADWKLVNEGPSGFWTTNHKGLDVAYIATTWKLKEKLYGSGKPEISAHVKGKLVYDPRLDTSPGANPTSDTYKAYSANPALCTADYLIDDQLGRGVATTKVDWDLVVTAANICDELVAIPGSTTQKRYTCFAVLEADADPRENIKALASAMMGICYRTGGKWRMYAGAAGTPEFALTAKNIAGKYSFRTATPQGDRYNFVRGTFRDATRNYLEVEYEPRSNMAYETADGLRLAKDAPFLTATDQWEAQRNSIIVSRRGRMEKTLTALFDLAAFDVRPWMVGTMTLEEVGWVDQRVVCMAWDFQGDGTIQMVLQEDDETIWDDPAVGQYITPGSGTSGTSSAYTPDPPSNLTATGLPGAIEFAWDAPIAQLPGDLIRIYEHTASTPFSSATKIWEGAGTSVVIAQADQTTRYYWALSYSPVSENSSSTTPATTGTAGAALAPPADGDPGAPGLNVATVFIYKRSASAPTLPSVATTYTFATGVLTGLNNGWTQAVPTTDGNPLYVSTATASNTTATDSIAAAEWATPRVMAEDGTDGSPGTNGLTVNLSRRIFSVQCDYLGTPVSGAFDNATGQIKVYYGTTDVTSSATYSGTATSCAGSVNTATNTPVTGAKGSYRITGSMTADTGYLTMTITYNGISVTEVFEVNKVLAGTNATTNSTTSVSITNSATYAAIAGPLTIPVGPGGTVTCSFGRSYVVSSGATSRLDAKFQYRTTPGSGSWVDLTGTVLTGSDSNVGEPGVVAGNDTKAGPASAANWEFQVVALKSGSGTITTSGSVSRFGVSWSD